MNHIFCMFCHWNRSERIRTRGVVSCFQTQIAFGVSSLCGCCAFFCSRSGSVFLCPLVHRSRGTAQVTSIASLDERQVRAVAFTAGIHCFSAEQLLDTRKRSRQNKKQEYMWGLWEGSFVPTASFCS